MASYLISTGPTTADYQIVHADSAKDAVHSLGLTEGTVEVWTLRSGEPRVYEVKVETVQTITRQEASNGK